MSSHPAVSVKLSSGRGLADLEPSEQLILGGGGATAGAGAPYLIPLPSSSPSGCHQVLPVVPWV